MSNMAVWHFNPFMPSGIFHTYGLVESICYFRNVRINLCYSLQNIALFYTNSKDPD